MSEETPPELRVAALLEDFPAFLLCFLPGQSPRRSGGTKPWSQPCSSGHLRAEHAEARMGSVGAMHGSESQTVWNCLAQLHTTCVLKCLYAPPCRIPCILSRQGSTADTITLSYKQVVTFLKMFLMAPGCVWKTFISSVRCNSALLSYTHVLERR